MVRGSCFGGRLLREFALFHDTKTLFIIVRLYCFKFSYAFTATVDLSDENGNMKNLVDHPLSYANELLKERESFVLIKIESKYTANRQSHGFRSTPSNEASNPISDY